MWRVMIVLVTCGSSACIRPSPPPPPREAVLVADAAVAPAPIAEPDAASSEPASDVKACGDGDDGACLRIVDKTGANSGITEEVIAYFASRAKKQPADVRACVEGDGRACGKLGEVFDASGDAEQARRFHRLACVQNYWFSCNNLSVMYGDKLGEIVSSRRFVRDCNRTHDGATCFWAGTHLMLVDREQGRKYLLESCERGYGTACHDYAAGLDRSDPAKYRELMEKGCKGGSPDACAAVKALGKKKR